MNVRSENVNGTITPVFLSNFGYAVALIMKLSPSEMESSTISSLIPGLVLLTHQISLVVFSPSIILLPGRTSQRKYPRWLVGVDLVSPSKLEELPASII